MLLKEVDKSDEISKLALDLFNHIHCLPVGQYFLSMNLPQKQTNADAITVITDWPWVSGFLQLPVWSQKWLQMRFVMNCSWFWVTFTISTLMVKVIAVNVDAGPQPTLKQSRKLKQGPQEAGISASQLPRDTVTHQISQITRSVSPSVNAKRHGTSAWHFYSLWVFRKIPFDWKASF